MTDKLYMPLTGSEEPALVFNTISERKTRILKDASRLSMQCGTNVIKAILTNKKRWANWNLRGSEGS